jgi:hypothetical protein
VRAARGLSAVSQKEWTSKSLLQHVPRTERVFSIIDTCWDMHVAPIGNDEIARSLFIDISQNIDQGVDSSGRVKTGTTSQQMYSFGRDRMLLAQEYLNLLGMPPCAIDGLSTAQVRDLYGEAFALPIVTLLTTSLLINAPFPDLWDSMA